MMIKIEKVGWFLFGTLCTVVGLYPFLYFVIDRHFGLLLSKSQELLTDHLWNVGFYGHITLGGLALLIGWTQFSAVRRSRSIHLHRRIGKLYVVAVLISGICGIYIGFFATGGMVSAVGFILLGIIWVASTMMAFISIRKKKMRAHENLMIISYAACFAAVTLRIWLPILTSLTGEFISAYRIVAWLCWVPNLVVAALIITRRNNQRLSTAS